MNKVYRVVWNVAAASWSAVAETAKGHTKGGGVAVAMAVAELPQSARPGRVFVAAAGSTYDGEVGTAIGASYLSRSGKWPVKVAADTSSRGADFGVAMHW
ncbi:hypothetical protein FAZ69_05650 [Trinickia terrae]|uniref:ESPR domain-containing protein n=1 Tax=Trinickia terrae TaxID=2571161 RepID=A0A4U1IC93_9BURK|nr:ESPR-type extended signal peptide-containing protein [Trinickia terrae]TKC91233.1 hypothetical protein FAZ69_05650 [Trinickia terrae]